jgi:DNA-binding NarL/FixJ family response regulator
MMPTLVRPRTVKRAPRRSWLTPPEIAVVDLVADGLTNQEIGARLFLSPRTVQTHLQNIGRRSGCTLREGIAGRAYLTGVLRQRPVGPAGLEAEPVRLTARQHQVLSLVARGFSTEEICAELDISVDTVKTHVARMLATFGARNRAHLVRLTIDAGELRLVPAAASDGAS